jgi:hypothetical protein
MKSSVIRLLIAFAAGAGCATVLAGGFSSEPITPEGFQQRSLAVLTELEALGQYVGTIEDDRVGLYTDPIACVPNPPVPKLPAGAVDPRRMRNAAAAVQAINEALILQDKAPVFEIAKCRPVK